MTLFALLICLWLQYILRLNPTRAQAWLHNYAHWGQHLLARWQLRDSVYSVCLLLAPPLLVVLGIDYALKSGWVNVLDFLLQVGVLFFCLDARSQSERLRDYFRAGQNDDTQAVFRHGLQFMDEAINTADDTIPDPGTFLRTITRHILLHADLYVFSVIFWYVVLGPAGAVLYAAARTFATPQASTPSAFSLAAQQVQAILNWLPSRLAALGYALAGHFSSAFIYLRTHLLHLTPSGEISVKTGLCALGHGEDDATAANLEESHAALELVNRSLIIWIAVIALCTLASWVA